MHSISRKSAVALRNIKSGELITEEALTMRRPEMVFLEELLRFD